MESKKDVTKVGRLPEHPSNIDRSKEMMEARVDAGFDSPLEDPEFLALMSGADGKLQMPMRSMEMRQ